MAPMRRLTALKVCMVLVSALVMAPFQHLHLAGAPGGQREYAIVHAHPYAFSAPVRHQTGTQVKEAHESTALNTFTFVPGIALILPFHISSSGVLFLFRDGNYDRVEIVQKRGHDPPWLDLSGPRAPPV